MQIEINEDDANVKLGTLIATCKGDGLYGVEAGIVIVLDLTFSIAWENKDEKKIWIYSKVDGDFDNEKLLRDNVAAGGRDTPKGPCSPVMPYTDTGISKAVTAFLSNLGLPGTASWSENGMQEAGAANFDADFETAKHFIPELVDEYGEED